MRRATTKGKFGQSNFRNFTDEFNLVLIQAQEVIQRMELASLIRFAFVKKAQEQVGINQ